MKLLFARPAALAVAALGALIPAPSQAVVVITAVETATGVTFSGSGSLNLAALTSNGTANGYSVFGGLGSLSGGNLILGNQGSPTAGVNFDEYQGITSVPAAGSFGTLSNAWGAPLFLTPSDGSGLAFGISQSGTLPGVLVPVGYVSGTPLSATSIYEDALSSTPLTFANFGLSPGTYTWSWGSGGTADSLVLQVGSGGSASVPSPLPLVGAGAAFGWARRMRRRLGRAGRGRGGL